MTIFINQFDIKYLMANKLGRSKINVIDSIPYSNLIFFIASGKNYALIIAEARGKGDSSPTTKQLGELERKGFLKSHKEKLNLLNKKFYSVNWDLIAEKFIKRSKEWIEEAKQSFSYIEYIQEAKFVNQHIQATASPYPENIKELIENFDKRSKEYIKNEIIREILKATFSNFSKSNISISVVYDKLINSLIIFSLGIQQDLQINTLLDDHEIKEFLEFSSILRGLKFQAREVNGLKQGFSKYIYTKEKKDVSKILDLINDLGIKENSLKNDFKTTKPTENKQNKSGNTNQNVSLSSETKQGENSK